METDSLANGRTFRVKIEKDYLVFCSAHFITHHGHKCESLHGHNYRTSAVFEGPVGSNWYVVDFGEVKRLLRTIVDELDHRVLLATKNKQIVLSEDDCSVEAVYRDRRYSFPRADVVLMPIENTTAELLAAYITKRVWEGLGGLDASLTSIEVTVEESFGQAGICRSEKAK
jgi:6-pyruvoyltetrahydropterin/6-carboxytetrahydropterin synthase